MDRKERLQAGPSDLSRLHKLSNPGALREGAEVSVIWQIRNNVLSMNTHRLEGRLRAILESNNQVGYEYIVYVLLPETLICKKWPWVTVRRGHKKSSWRW